LKLPLMIDHASLPRCASRWLAMRTSPHLAEAKLGILSVNGFSDSHKGQVAESSTLVCLRQYAVWSNPAELKQLAHSAPGS